MEPPIEYKDRISIHPATKCWEWKTNISHDGYGRVEVNGRQKMAHRHMWEVVNGRPVPMDKQIHHKCNNRRCVNPDHLEPLSARDNTLLSGNPAAHNSKKEFCDRGHPFDEDNTYERVRGGGGRSCRVCQNMSMTKRRGQWKGKLADKPMPFDCKNGHGASEDNWVFLDNRWQCKECDRERCARKRAKNVVSPINKPKPDVCLTCSSTEFRWVTSNKKWLCVPCHKAYMKAYNDRRKQAALEGGTP